MVTTIRSINCLLTPKERGLVAKNLQLPDDSIKRLVNLEAAEAKVRKLLPTSPKSQVFQLLQPYDDATLILLVVRSPKIIRRQIWLYLNCWANIQAPLNGDDLKKLGYKPSPQFRQMLEDLLIATLDGIICDRSSAEKYLSIRYPL